MRILGVKVEENPYYCSYEDECWITLAQEIMTSYADKYAYQIPTTAYSQEEYNRLDRRTYLPIRQSILRNVMNGPLKSIADIHAIYSGFEQRRMEYKQSMGITWADESYDFNEVIGK